METSFSALEYLNDEMGSISTLSGKSEGVAAHTHHLPGEAKGKLHSHREKPVYETKDGTGSEDMLKFGGLRAKTERQPSPDLGNSGSEQEIEKLSKWKFEKGLTLQTARKIKFQVALLKHKSQLRQ